MSFKKLQPELLEALDRLKITEPLPFQKKVLSKIKGGASVFGIAPEGSGKTTSIVISTIQKLECAAFEDAPRALIFVKDKEAALALEQEFKRFTYRMDLRVYCAYEEYDFEAQKNDIYDGVDIVIATPKRLNKIFFLNGINLGKLKLFFVEDAEFLVKSSMFADVIRTPESLERCQYVVFSTVFDHRMTRMQELFMANAQIVKM
ncbi:DEAD/DEAH box helicase [Arenibacter nanhaiticus]|uniref:DEAD/DEAH box helicase n=1 Tax=Arenibacter nanhaiticus TaxID=558155 RepID=A0A1M6FTL5_9FLAO|nr:MULTISPECIES: DEAD/DEAH box helicase [Arenibacter]NKI24977.1 DEAD/DEAH box helicase [Arenibacter sp. 6A1]SHJ01020.1 DEAD/DEAH box helicase [Arenibacter nanhaiticus]